MKQATLKVGMRVRIKDVPEPTQLNNKIGIVTEILDNGAVVKVGRIVYFLFANELSRT